MYELSLYLPLLFFKWLDLKIKKQTFEHDVHTHSFTTHALVRTTDTVSDKPVRCDIMQQTTFLWNLFLIF